MSRVGVIALARPTFDVDYAAEIATLAFGVIDTIAPDWVGSRELCFDAEATRVAIDMIVAAGVDSVVVLQVTFTDATMVKEIAESVGGGLVLWAFPEARTGGRLRLNSLCGLNLATYAMGRMGHGNRYLYLAPDDADAPAELSAAIKGGEKAGRARLPAPPLTDADVERGAAAVAALAGRTTGVIGDHPDGFDPCSYDASAVRELTGVTVQSVELPDLFSAAAAAQEADVAQARRRAESALGELGNLDQAALENSLRIYCGLAELAGRYGWSGFSTRCWPECFTELGAAACAPQAMMTGDGTPGGCEADAYGTLTSLLLQELAGEPPFVADLVDVDVSDSTAVFWHCGVAPLQMADPAIGAQPTIHSNRGKPLLHEFPLKPGRITIARLSQSRGEHRLVVGSGEMLAAPLPFSGTAGTVRFDLPARQVLATVLEEGLEHHYGIVYGDYAGPLAAAAVELGIPLLRLT